MLHISTPSGRWSAFAERLLAFLRADIVEMPIDGRLVRGFRSPDNPALWIRDHSDMLRAGKYFEADLKSAADCFADAQAANGRIYDYVITAPETWTTARENWERWVRVPVEADVEYRFVKTVYLAWQATGDTAWMTGLIPACERALRYTMTHPWRWDPTHRLVKRAYTIDTWDFDYTAGRHDWLNFQVTPHTFWGLMHGDNSGLYEAMNLLATLLDAAGRAGAAGAWREEAAGLRERANALLFNGRFYTHFFKLTPVEIPDVDEAEQLSLSNPMDINRGMATPAIARAILEEYRRRKESTGAFAEWFSIDPPFPKGHFGEDKLVPGAYVNGGVMPLVGGELSRAAFEHGFESYGVDILQTYDMMTASSGETHLWYFPNGEPASVETSTSPEAQPTDGWGSSAMLFALVEGLCGIVDWGHSFERVRCAPRWEAAGEREATVHVAYAASGAGFGYRYLHNPEATTLTLAMEADDAEVELSVLLPAGAQPAAVRWAGAPVAFKAVDVAGSRYATCRGRVQGVAEVHIAYR
ncbi:MAG: hypothetical protein R2834_01845 [Rhodothermales bacterium]